MRFYELTLLTKLFKDGLICLHDQYRSNIGQSVFVPKVEEAVLERGSIDDEKHDFSSECRNILKLFPHADRSLSCHAHEKGTTQLGNTRD